MFLHDIAGRRPRVHFIGIGGTAMVAGARLALDAGWEVRGSDNPLYPPTSDMVAALGVPVASGYAAANLDWEPDAVIVGNAVSRGNPEVEAALERRMTYISLPEWLKEAVLRARIPVVVAGTHGKTTTTALTAHVLAQCGLAPGYLIGGQPLGFPHSARLGDAGAPFVIEGDEYDTAFFDKRAKFFHYLPNIAVVTSVEFDHGDIYANLGEIERAFRWMLRQMPASGRLLLCADNPGAAALAAHAFCPVETYGTAGDARWRGACRHDGAGLVLTVYRAGERWLETAMPLAGRHNLQNTLAAIGVAAALGATPDQIAAALPSFGGVRRRMEVFLEAGGAVYVDDFGHHPTAIRETIAAAREKWPGRRLWAVFEPRSNTSATNSLQDELIDAIRGADRVWLGPIHRVDAIPPEKRLDRETVVAALQRDGVWAAAAGHVDAIFDDIVTNVLPGDVVLFLSNGAFGGIYARLRAHFRADLQP